MLVNPLFEQVNGLDRSTFNEIMLALDNEIAYQNIKYGTPEQRNLAFGDYLQYIRNEFNEVENSENFNDAKCELLQVAALCIACIKRFGLVERPNSDLEKLLPELVSK